MSPCVRFGRCELRADQRLLLIDGQASPLGARAFDLLVMLVAHHDRVVTKPELMAKVWPGAVVEDNNLTVQISVLRKLIGADAIATVAGRGYRFVAQQQVVAQRDQADDADRTGTARPSVAVLPFENLTGDAGQDYLADGLAEDIIASLSHSPWLLVITRSSSFAHRDQRARLQTVCQQLGVRYAVTGTLRHAGPTIRISAELTDGHSGQTLWSDRYDRPAEQLIELQDTIAATIVATIEPLYLRHEEQRAVREASHGLLTLKPRNLQHWHLVMRARWHYWRSARWHSQQAKLLLEEALLLQPDDAATHALLSFSLLTDTWSGWADDVHATIARAHDLALKAISIDDGDAFGHFTMGVAMACMGRMDRAIAEQRQALALYPHFAAAAAELGRLLAFSGQTQEALHHVQHALRVSPSDPRRSLWLFTLAIISFVDGEHGDAAHHAADAVVQRPDWFFNHYLLAACNAAAGRMDDARRALTEAQRLMPDFSVATLKIGHPFTRRSDHDRYVAALRAAGWSG